MTKNAYTNVSVKANTNTIQSNKQDVVVVAVAAVNKSTDTTTVLLSTTSLVPDVHKQQKEAAVKVEDDLELDDLDLDDLDDLDEEEDVYIDDKELEDLDLEEEEEEEKEVGKLVTSQVRVDTNKAANTNTTDTTVFSRNASDGTMNTGVMISSHPSNSTDSKWDVCVC